MNSKKIHAVGISEQKTKDILYGYEKLGIDIDIIDNNSILEISINADTKSETTNDGLINISKIMTERLGQNVLSCGTVQENVVELLKSRCLKLATAESCTSGLISAKITEISGASEVFDFGISAYSNDIKMKALHVPEEIIEKFGAVSSQTAAYMAIGAMRVSGADIGLSITGVAGPGISEGKPVGLIYIGLCDKRGLWVLKLELDGDKYDREHIRERAANLALDFVRRYLSFENFGATLYRGNDDYCTSLSSLVEHSINKDVEYPDIVFFSNSKPVCYPNLDKIKKVNAWETIRKLFPTRNDKIAVCIRKTVAILLCVSSIVFSVCIVSFFAAENKESSVNKELLAEYNKSASMFDSYKLDENGVFSLFSSLKSKNSDLIGWISNSNFSINSVVMSSDFYAENNFYKQPSKYGTVYVDSSCDVSSETRSKNVILYGKNAVNGSVFGSLDNYLSTDYLRNNPIIKFDSYNDNGKYVIVSVFRTSDNDDFNYKRANFVNSDECVEYIEAILMRSLFTVTLDVLPEDDFITLITDTKENSELVVFARRMRSEENFKSITAYAKAPIEK